MAFFPGLHELMQSAVFSSAARHPNLKRSIAITPQARVQVRGGRRYLSKDN